MPRLIAFLRAINVGGHTVTMAELRRLFEALGLTDVETFIASGNVIFMAPRGDTAVVQRKIEEHLRQSLGYEVKAFVRTDAEIAAIAQYKPFKAAQLQSAQALNVAFLEAPLGAVATKALMGLPTGIDDFHVNGREVYWLCRKKQSQSTFSNVRFEKTVDARATFRGLNTVAKLAAKYSKPK